MNEINEQRLAEIEANAVKACFAHPSDIMLVRDLCAALRKAQAERDEAREWVNKLTREQRTLTCVYCGHAYPPGSPTHGANVLTKHIATCKKHPMRVVEHDRDEWKRRAEEAIALGVEMREALEHCRHRPHIHNPTEEEMRQHHPGGIVHCDVIDRALSLPAPQALSDLRKRIEAEVWGEAEDFLRRAKVPGLVADNFIDSTADEFHRRAAQVRAEGK